MKETKSQRQRRRAWKKQYQTHDYYVIANNRAKKAIKEFKKLGFSKYFSSIFEDRVVFYFSTPFQDKTIDKYSIHFICSKNGYINIDGIIGDTILAGEQYHYPMPIDEKIACDLFEKALRYEMTKQKWKDLWID